MKSVLVDFSILHDEINVVRCIHQQANILGWVAVDDENIRKSPFLDHTKLSSGIGVLEAREGEDLTIIARYLLELLGGCKELVTIGEFLSEGIKGSAAKKRVGSPKNSELILLCQRNGISRAFCNYF